MKKIAVIILAIMLGATVMSGCQAGATENPVQAAEVQEPLAAENTEDVEKFEVDSDDVMDVDDAEYSDDIDASEYEKYNSDNSTTSEISANGEVTGNGSVATNGSNGSNSSNSSSGSNGSNSTSDGGTDRYQTSPTPDGRPAPVEWQDVQVNPNKQLSCTILIDCSTILNNMGNLTPGKEGLVPSNGVIMAKKTVKFYEGESVSDVLKRETKNNRIHMEFSTSPVYNSDYIEGINNLYEFDCGNLSGWMYNVNGWYPNYGASRYMLKDGDAIEWRYTCDLGRDLGTTWEK